MFAAFMARHGIPTARYRVCESSADARALVASVIWIPGRAQGGRPCGRQGASSSRAIATKRTAIRAQWTSASSARRARGSSSRAWDRSLVLRALRRHAPVPIASAQDHKRIFDNDEGPNTGGMGAFSPSPLVDGTTASQIMREAVDPVLRGMRAEGTEYRGFLYAGLMMTCAGPKVIEYNVRFGDPEAQAVMPLTGGELLPLVAAAADGNLGGRQVTLNRGVSVGVVLASAGYPGPVRNGAVIHGLDAAARVPDVIVFHAGTARRGADVVTAGGRVLTVVATGQDYRAAIDRAYQAVSLISFEGMRNA